MKCGFVTIIGRPNVGKSTLLNQILGQKIVIATDKAQTTRKRIKGILTDENGQIIFIDTPGIHRPLNKLGEFLLDEAKIAVPDADVILFLVDGTEPAGKGDKWIAENVLKQSKSPIILVMNKLDKIKNMQKVEENLMSYKMLFEENIPVIRISAKTGRNKDTLLSNIIKKLPDGEKLYPDDIDRIYAIIYCEQKSQKGILIGKGGSLLKTIGTQARLELEEITEKKVFLSLEVKVEKDWRKKDKVLKDFGYFQEKE